MEKDYNSISRKNPSRKTCEDIIRRILTTEANMPGSGRHFRQAADFISYFESLYPASPSLTKQVQRVVASMKLARDTDGYFMIDRTQEEYALEQELAHLLTEASLHPMEQSVPVLLEVEAPFRQYLIYLAEHSVPLRDKYDTILETSNGVLFYTSSPEKLKASIQELLDEGKNDTR